jgi:RsiW-degrading membrane proteinase PrsW (M82 family)
VARSRKLTRRGKALILLFFVILVFAVLSYVLSWFIESLFSAFLGEALTQLVAPIVEELLKPLGLVLLAAMFLRTGKKQRAKKRRPVGIDWLKSIKVDYVIGYAGGLVFGVLESGISYHTFSGLRAVTPFFHAFTTGMVGVGIYFGLTRGKKEIVKLIPIYIFAILLHSTWNSASLVVERVIGLFAFGIGFSTFLYILYYLAKHAGKPRHKFGT